eukprot:1156772-Pelagomonas_calceolata.AAC.25
MQQRPTCRGCAFQYGVVGIRAMGSQEVHVQQLNRFAPTILLKEPLQNPPLMWGPEYKSTVQKKECGTLTCAQPVAGEEGSKLAISCRGVMHDSPQRLEACNTRSTNMNTITGFLALYWNFIFMQPRQLN